MADLPELGVGVMWFAGLVDLVAASEPDLDYLEFEPTVSSLGQYGEPLLGVMPPVERGKPLLVHGVTCAVGGSVPPRAADLAALGRVAAWVDAPWVSDHLSVNRLTAPDGAPVDAGFLLPPAQTPGSVAVAARNLRLLRAAVGRPVAFETGVNYFRPQPGHLSDGEFFAAVAEAADCYILCDLHNLWCNERNGRQPVRDVIDALPVERVCELHLAGGQEHRGFLLDAHSGTVDPLLLELAVEIAERLPRLRAVTFELMPDYVRPNGIDATTFRRQIRDLRTVWNTRGRAVRPDPPARRAAAQVPVDESGRWNDELASAVHGAGLPVGGGLSDDPGAEIYKDLIDTMRMGNVVTALPLSYRLLTMTVGMPESDRLLRRYLAEHRPCEWAYDEARQVRAYLEATVTNCPHLSEMLAFEIGAYEAVLTGNIGRVPFTCEPTGLIDALRRGQLPQQLTPGSYEVLVQP